MQLNYFETILLFWILIKIYYAELEPLALSVMLHTLGGFLV